MKSLELRKFLLAANSARTAVTFKKVKTLTEACALAGVAVPRKYNPESTPDVKTLNKIVKTYERWYRRHKNFDLPRKVKREDPKDLGSVRDNQGSSEDFDIPVPPRNPLQKCTLYPFQEREAKKIWNHLIHSNNSGAMLRMNVGDGKTFVFGQVIRWLYDSGWVEKHKEFSVFPVVVLTKATIVEQTSRDLEDEFGLKVPDEVLVINYDSLRASFGKTYINTKTIVENGDVKTEYIWRPLLHPCFFVLDEYQALKNTESAQSEIAQAINNISPAPKILCSSATPFSRVTSAKVFAVSTHKKFHHVGLDLELTNNNWLSYAKNIAFPSAPEEFNKASIQRLVKDLKPYIFSPTRRSTSPPFLASSSIFLICSLSSRSCVPLNLASPPQIKEI